MKKEDLFQAIGECDEELLHKSEKRVKKKSFKGKMIGIVAAAAILGFVCFNMNELGVFLEKEQYVQTQEEPQKDTERENVQTDETEDAKNESELANSNEGETEQASAGSDWGKEIDATMGGCGEETEDDYLPSKDMYGLNPEYENCSYYSGVILPLTLEQENEQILAARTIDFDFKKFDSFENEGNVVITDTYTLENTSDKEQVINVKYPLELSLREVDENLPVANQNGKTTQTNLEAGRYYGTDESGNRCSLGIYPPQEYVSLLKDDKTLLHNQDDSILDEKVIVYEYQCAKDVKDGCYTAQMWAENEGNYTRYTKDKDNINVYSANMDSYHLEDNTEYYGFLTEKVKKTGRTPMLIFFGSEPKEYREQAYTGLLYSEKTKMDDLQVELVRYESTFRQVLYKLVEEEIVRLQDENEGLVVSKELYNRIAGAVLADVVKDNQAGENDTEYSFADAWENNISAIVECVYAFRYEYYLTDEITIPAGETVTYEIHYEREGSHDYTAAELEYMGNYGYDNMPTFGTNLNFTNQNATIKDHGYISILNQNYGFDLENGIKEVVLDMDVEYYYMVVRRFK